MAETPDKAIQDNKQPDAPQQQAGSSRVPVILVSLSALAILGAATANSLPGLDRFALPDISLPNVSLPSISLPSVSLPHFNFSGFSLPNFDRFMAQSPHVTASVSVPIPKVSAPIPDPVVTATLKDIQSSQQQTTAVLVSLTQSSANQQADLRRISRQLNSLAAQAEALQNAVAPLTTGSIPRTNPRARVVRAQAKATPPLPKPFGPVSVGGAPLSPTPASGSRAG